MMFKWICMVFLVSCSSSLHIPKNVNVIWNNGTPIQNLRGTIKEIEFKNNQDAKTYAMERRLLLLRKFEIISEPYFGTANAKRCTDNIQSTLLETTENSMKAVMQILTNGEDRIIYDCLEENNTDWAHIEFVVCDRVFYDIRVYHPIDKKPEYKSLFRCKT